MGARQLICCLAVLVLLAGCHKSTTDTAAASTTEGGGVATTQQNGTTSTNYPPGSEAQFVAEVGDRVFFGYNEFDLTPQARTTIEHQAQWMKTYPSVNVMVEGHCDERGTREYNLALGARRANAVKEYLVSQGVTTGRVETVSYGKERPICTSSDEACWAQNRRGVTTITGGANS
jgi:peptidoglycan-associated lipoprotein